MIQEIMIQEIIIQEIMIQEIIIQEIIIQEITIQEIMIQEITIQEITTQRISADQLKALEVSSRAHVKSSSLVPIDRLRLHPPMSPTSDQTSEPITAAKFHLHKPVKYRNCHTPQAQHQNTRQIHSRLSSFRAGEREAVCVRALGVYVGLERAHDAVDTACKCAGGGDEAPQARAAGLLERAQAAHVNARLQTLRGG
eukprot:763067-Hanusia_phi.AAC.1